MENSKLFKISGALVILILIIVGSFFISKGGSLQGKLTRKFDEIQSFPAVEVNNEVNQFQKNIQNETDYLLSECSQLKYKLSKIKLDIEKLDNEFVKIHGEREQNYYKAEQLQVDWNKVNNDEYLPYVAEYNSYKEEYDQLKKEIEKIEKKHGMTLEEAQKLYYNLLYDATIDPKIAKEKLNKIDALKADAKPIIDKMTEVVNKMKDLNSKGGATASKKLKNIDDQIKAYKAKYDEYTNNLTVIESQIEKKWEEIAALEEEIAIKCGTPKNSQRGDKEKSSGNRNGKNYEQDASERWSQGIDSQSREIDELTVPETFEIGEDFSVEENTDENSERVVR